MTDTQRQVLQGLIDGKTYAQIGKEMGVSRQAAFSYARDAIRTKNSKRRETYKYPNLVHYIFEVKNYKSVRSFAQDNNLCYQTIILYLQGKHKPSIDILTNLSSITGMAIDDIVSEVKTV